MRAPIISSVLLVLLVAPLVGTSRPVPSAAIHPQLLFSAGDLASLRTRAAHPVLKPVAARLLARADALMKAPPLMVSLTKRGEPDLPGQLKGLEAARRLQGRVLTFAMAFLLTGDARYRDAAVGQLDRALADWPIWVDTAHQPPFDLMTGEVSLTFGLAWDWLYHALTPAERQRLREGVERRSLERYLDATKPPKPMFWFTAHHNWNTVTNGGATVLALALGGESALSAEVLARSAGAMAHFWDHLGDDGGWDEGTGYWEYGNRYAFIAAEALRRAGRPEGAAYLSKPGARQTGWFPLVFNPGTTLSASFGDSPSRAADPLFYFLAREYQSGAFAWYQDRVRPPGLDHEGWPEEALTLIWRPLDEPWLPEAKPDYRSEIPPVKAFPSIGWAMLAPETPDPPFFLSLKNGSLAANHTHLDLNHLSVGVGSTMLLVDLGSRPYPADYFGPRRNSYYEISTAGHNTVLVGGRGQTPGKTGALLGPYVQPYAVEFIGVADQTYDTPTPRARRHVVFVDRRYYVILDEVDAAAPSPIELRFHTYGAVAAQPDGAWLVSQSKQAVLVVPADAAAVTGTVETPAGWIKPVKVLRLASTRADGHLLLATVIVPLPGRTSAPAIAVSQTLRDRRLEVSVGADRLVFKQGDDGFRLTGG